MKKIVVLSILAVLSAGSKTQASGLEKDKVNFGIMPGISVPLGDFKKDFKSSFAMGASVEYSVKEDLRAGLEMGYSFRHEAKDIDYNVKILSLTPVIKKLWDDGKYTYYGVAGAGLYRWSTPSFTYPFIGTVPSDSATSFGFNIGGGVSYQLQNGLMAGLDMRWHHLFSSEGDHVKLSAVNSLMIGAKLDYRFK